MRRAILRLVTRRRGVSGSVLAMGILAIVIALAAAAPVSANVPVIDVPGPITREATSSAGASVSFTVTSDAGDPTCDHASGDTFPIATTTVTCTATNADGPGSASFTITVQDTTPPVVHAPADISTGTTDPGGKTVNYSGQSANDAVDGDITPVCTPASGSNFPVGTTTVTCRATDARGHEGTDTSTITVTLEDNTPPVVHAPANISTTTTDPGGKSVTYSGATATDNLDGSITPSCTPGSGSNFPVGTTTVTCTATDAHGNPGSDTFTITVSLVDTTPPVVHAPADISTTTPVPTGKSVAYSGATATDNVDGSITPSCTPGSGSNFPVGATTVSCSATDAHGNKGTDTFTITVTLVDNTPPVVHAPADISTTTTVPGGKSVTYSGQTATDNLDGSLTPSCTPASGSNFPVGATTVSCSATDAHGNKGTDTFTITVSLVDTTKPVVHAPADISTTTPVPTGKTVTYSGATATDNIDGSITPSCTPGSGSNFPVGATTVTCSATDAHGNTGSDTFTVTVALVDTTKPVVTAPGNITREATSGDGAVVTFSSGTATDNLDGSLTPSCTPASGSTFPLGATTVTCSATDAHGNTGTDTFKITIIDTTAPTVTAPADLTREANGPTGAKVTFAVTASDLGENLPVPPAGPTDACLPHSGSTFPLGKTVVTCTVDDGSGNAGHASFAITVVDTTPPRLNVPAAMTLSSQNPLPASAPMLAAFLSVANATDLVDGSVPVTNNAPASFPMGTTTVTFTAVDKAGHKATAGVTVTLTVAPAPPPPPPNAQPPAAIAKLAAKAGAGSVVLTWAAPGENDFDHVVVEQSAEGSPLTIVYKGSATSYTAKGLKNGSEYRFVVVSFDKAGNASPEAAVVATPAVAMLIQPKDGAVAKAPPVLDWRDVPGASYYNVQLYRVPSTLKSTSAVSSGSKVLSIWPTKSSLKLSAKWVFSKKSYTLAPGAYRWFVWAGFGPRAEVKYGPLLGQSTFLVRASATTKPPARTAKPPAKTAKPRAKAAKPRAR